MPQPPSISKRNQHQQIWYQRGRRGAQTWVHRLDGPAIVFPREQQWYFQGSMTVRATNWEGWAPTIGYAAKEGSPHAPTT